MNTFQRVEFPGRLGTLNQAPRLATNGPKPLVQDFGGPEYHCKNQPDMDKCIGPEDMKLFWSRTEEPLLIFTHQANDENLYHGQFLIEARVVVSELEKVLNDEYSQQMPPIRFCELTGLHRNYLPAKNRTPA